MKRSTFLCLGALMLAVGALPSCFQEPASPTLDKPGGQDAAARDARQVSTPAAQPVVFATGLLNPRGLEWGPDGYLYVAEGGSGGNNSTVGQCEQVPGPVGPYTGSPTGGRISKISRDGVVTTLVDNLPSTQTSPTQGSLVSGVADVAFIGDHLYALLAAGGCSHGNPTIPNGVVEVEADGTWTLIADLSAWLQSHPVARPEADDFEPDGDWYSMVAVRGDLYAVESNHGDFVRISPDGQIRRVADISASFGHIVPTSVAYHGNFFIGNLNPFPIVEGSSQILKVTPSGQLKTWVSGLTTVLGVAFDGRGRLYVLENTTGNPFPTPNTGRILRIDARGEKVTIASGINLPTAMTFGPDGDLYVSAVGFGAPAVGLGEVLRIDIGDSH